ncbi:MAG: sensor histidine kinase [Ignavibacteriaceae bacterium]|nr:sensor histidine kinase [Ignavibacteriaceae bacterium]
MNELIVRDNMIEGIAIISFEWKYLYNYEANGGRPRIFSDDMIGRKIFDEALGDEKSIFFKLCHSVMNDRVPQQVEKEYTLTDGTNHWFQVNAAPVPEGIIVQTSDITEKKLEESLLKASLNKKDVLLRELYHRTKNNMQVISSLFSLKASYLIDAEMKIIFNDMTNRIKTISKIHDMLHESTDLTQVDLSQYILHIIQLLSRSFLDKSERISIKKELEEIKVDIDTAISCGLIINELITNSLKYAFPGDRKGEILVKLAKPDDKIELCVSDNGIGIEKMELHEGKLGLQIFRLIADNQLKAETKLHINNGVTVNLRFLDNKYEKNKSIKNTLKLA